jgi:hypothetical protein
VCVRMNAAGAEEPRDPPREGTAVTCSIQLDFVRRGVLSALLAATGVVCLAVPALAQSARAVGVVRDLATGKPMKGATVRAVNPDAYPSELTSATDDKGRWAMIGLRTGTWRFIVEAPGYLRLEAPAPIRVAMTAPMVFTLARDPGPIPNALDKDIQRLLKDARELRAQGRLDQAIASYQDIRTKNPKLSHVNLVLADTHRQKALLEADPAARRAQIDLALQAYTEVLKQDAGNELAASGIASLRADGGAPNP